MKLKMVVASTPKTGNTWLRHLLSEIYRLPMPTLPPVFSEDEVARLPERWVNQEHYFPEAGILGWAERENAVILTTIRHPGDVLVSLYHYYLAFEDDPRFSKDPVRAMGRDREGPGQNVIFYARHHFPHYLRVSTDWMKTGRSIVVRYEDLCEDPEAEMEKVVRAVNARCPEAGLPLDRIPGAVAACDIDMLRQTPGLDRKFFRKGGSGGWIDELPAEVVGLFRNADPYPSIFEALGYSSDPAAAQKKKPRRPRTVQNPFAGVERFEDGIGVTHLLVRTYFQMDAAVRSTVRPLSGRDEVGSFLGWLCAPAEEDPARGADPYISNLAMALHSTRIDLQRAFPKPFEGDRPSFAAWFLHSPKTEYALDPRLLEASRRSYLAWANAPSAGAAPLTNLARWIYERRTDLHEVFPRPHGADGEPLLRWMVENASNLRLDPAVVAHLEASLAMRS